MNGNKGEWSKVYVLLKFIADGKISSDEFSYPISIIKRNNIEVSRQITPENLVLIKNKNISNSIKEISIKKFKEITPNLYNDIRNGKGSFSIPYVEKFLKLFGVFNLITNPQVKNDIEVVINKPDEEFKKSLSFIIKSKIGSLPTFFNASMGSNITYKIVKTSLNNDQIKEINHLMTINNKIDTKGRVKKLYEYGCELEFYEIQKKTFDSNLKFIDRDLPFILSELLMYYYLGEGTSLKDLLEIIRIANPCNYDLDYEQAYYERRVKDLLTESFLGMTTSKIWKSKFSKQEGILIVEKNGSISCYHGFLKRDFQDYIIRNTKLDTPSAKRHKFATIFHKGNDLFFKLNFQIRWII